MSAVPFRLPFEGKIIPFFSIFSVFHMHMVFTDTVILSLHVICKPFTHPGISNKYEIFVVKFRKLISLASGMRHSS